MEQSNQELLTPELYFLIQKLLAASSLTETHKAISKELEEQKILPPRYDWEGNKHERTYEDLERLYPHIGPTHLLEICSRIGPILDKEIPPCIRGVRSLLGSGRQSLLRVADSFKIPHLTSYYATRRNGTSICDPFNPKITHSITHILAGREISGPVPRALAFPPTRYAQMQLQFQTLGHLSAVYCLLFDKTGKYIVSGADDLLVKVWSANTGRLLNSFRGASAELTDIDINKENSLLAAGSIDKILRVWDLQTGAPVAVLTGHTGTITSVHFCPTGNYDVRYLTTTSSDGSVAFWTYQHEARNRVHFSPKPILYQEKMRPGQSQMICSSFSPGGAFLAAGSADHHVRIYLMRGDEGPVRILETEVHTDRVDSIVWAHKGLRFVSGSKDGTAYIWHFERQQWKFMKLSMDTRLPDAPKEEQDQEPKKFHVTMVAWDYSDTFVVTAVSDHCLKVWDAATGQLQRVLAGHTDGVFVLESHPKDPYVMLSTGHDGEMFVWDLLRGTKITRFTNNLDNGQGIGAVFDAKWSPDGSMFAATDSHGHIMLYAFGVHNQLLKKLPKELFFHTDYRPLVRDANHVVRDEQTQALPHMMPPPFLVDIDGNPYPPMLQRLVPGREHCTTEQLVPNIVVDTGGRQEVIEGVPPRSDIDRMIAALAQRQYGNDDQEAGGSNGASPRAVGNGPRRSAEGSVEGIRQSTGDWQRDANFEWSRKVLIQPLSKIEVETTRIYFETLVTIEMADYQRENKKRPLMINTAAPSALNDRGRNRRRRNGNVNTRRTRRPVQAQVHDAHDGDDDADGDVDAEESNHSTTSASDSSASAKEEDLSLSDSSSDTEESSGYSDWVADQGENLEPPKRSKRKPAAHRSMNGDDGPGTSSNSSKPQAKRIPYSKIKNGEIPDAYKDLDWVSKTVPRKAPYCPQMGDEVVYFVQGHQMYVEAVRNKKIYTINNRDLPWTKTTLRDKEFVKIVYIKYIIKPPRLCCLKLALLDEENKITDKIFTIKYHDMADVLDFIVLKQTYETAVAHSWNIGDRFRCMIDDGWWTGKIEAKTDFSEEHPESLFMCYEIQWDNGEKERMCPWDLEPIREDRLPETVGEAVPVLPDEIQSILYQPTVDEWPRGDRDAACRRIIACLDKVMSLAIAEPFLTPVDLNLYPTYALVVEYPVDLSTIKARFENHFYRRIAAAQFDVRYLATNAEQFNEPHSVIVKSARIITDLCLRIIKQSTEDIDVQAVYHQLMDTYTSCSDDDHDDDARPGPSSASNTRHLQARSLRSCNGYIDWRVEAKRLLDDFFKMRDSVPFRQPVDTMRHPDYLHVVDTPMDLSTVREELYGGNYEMPLDFAKDMRLIFNNSKNFNTNKRSRIYAMTVRLAAKFEEQFSKITSNWKRSKNKGAAVRKSGRRAPARAKSRNSINSDNSEKENRYRRKRTTNRAANNSKRHMPSTSRVHDPTTSDEEEENAMVDADRVPRAGRAATPDDSDDDDEQKPAEWQNEQAVNARTQDGRDSSSDNSDDDSPLLQRKCTRRIKSLAEDFEELSDDSDYKPLSSYANNHKRKKPAIRESSSGEEEEEERASSASNDESSSSDSDSGIKKNLRPRSKRRRLQLSEDNDDGEEEEEEEDDDTDSDNLPLKRYENRHNDDSAESDHVMSVSSRGRVRKLTEKARTLWKK